MSRQKPFTDNMMRRDPTDDVGFQLDRLNRTLEQLWGRFLSLDKRLALLESEFRQGYSLLELQSQITTLITYFNDPIILDEDEKAVFDNSDVLVRYPTNAGITLET
jgi:hypothetical protein